MKVPTSAGKKQYLFKEQALVTTSYLYSDVPLLVLTLSASLETKSGDQLFSSKTVSSELETWNFDNTRKKSGTVLVGMMCKIKGCKIVFDNYYSVVQGN